MCDDSHMLTDLLLTQHIYKGVHYEYLYVINIYEIKLRKINHALEWEITYILLITFIID